MRAETFVPGHISCVFRPVRTDDVLSTGSLGFGIRTSLGCNAKVEPRDDKALRIFINGEESDAPVTRYAIESMDAGMGFDIHLEHGLPLEQGFGASASGTFGAALCVASLAGLDRFEAVKAAHKAECNLGGGLGDLAAINSGFGVPIREVAGVQGITGRTSDSGLSFPELTLIVFNEPLKTESVLSDENEMKKIVQAGDVAMRRFSVDRTIPGLFDAANEFSEFIGLESGEIKDALSLISKEGYRAGMCMLGNSIYSDISMERAKELFSSASVYKTASYSGPIEVTRTE